MLGVAPANIRVIDLLVMPSVTPRSLRRLHWVMVPGLVSRLAPVRPVTAVIKIKHAGLNLTGPLWSNWSWMLCAACVRNNPG